MNSKASCRILVVGTRPLRHQALTTTIVITPPHTRSRIRTLSGISITRSLLNITGIHTSTKLPSIFNNPRHSKKALQLREKSFVTLATCPLRPRNPCVPIQAEASPPPRRHRSSRAMSLTSHLPPLEGVEGAKRAAAYQAVKDHFSPKFTHIGIGSGTTIKYVVDAIRESCANAGKLDQIFFIPTGYQSRMEIESRGLVALKFDSLAPDRMLDVAFDGADEVDEQLNCIKGGGACLFQEKLVAMRARKFICVADYRKDVARLLTGWSYIPIEVAPIAAQSVIKTLKELGCPNPEVRHAGDPKSGPLKTDQDFFILQAPFPRLVLPGDKHEAGATGKTIDGQTGRIWEVLELASAIKAIQGVLDVGLFVGKNGPDAQAAGEAGGQKPIAVYFGMQDGSVKMRTAP